MGRLFFFSLEGTLSYLFCDVEQRKYGRSVDHLCLWEASSLSYKPECSHSCFRETP